MDSNSLENAIEMYGQTLSKFCRSLCQNEHNAQDLYQDTWLKFLRTNVQFKDEPSRKAYIFRICLNSFRNVCRHEKRHQSVSIDDEKNAYLADIADTTNSREEYSLLYDALRRLPCKHRSVIVLSYFKDLDENEVAAVLKIPKGTVKSRLYAAKKALKKELEQND